MWQNVRTKIWQMSGLEYCTVWLMAGLDITNFRTRMRQMSGRECDNVRTIMCMANVMTRILQMSETEYCLWQGLDMFSPIFHMAEQEYGLLVFH